MGSQDIGRLRIQSDFLRGANINLREIILVDVAFRQHLILSQEAAICQNVLLAQFLSGTEHEPSPMQVQILLIQRILLLLSLHNQRLLISTEVSHNLIQLLDADVLLCQFCLQSLNALCACLQFLIQ